MTLAKLPIPLKLFPTNSRARRVGLVIGALPKGGLSKQVESTECPARLLSGNGALLFESLLALSA
jgi:hypothetical protein